MTSSGYRSQAPALTALAIMAFTAASVLVPACADAESVFGRPNPSARIHALGSYFAGVIPDQLTDLTLNPASAWNAESLTINYGIRDPYNRSYPFPISGINLVPDFTGTSIYNTNEIRLFGLSAWGLKWAVDTEWRLSHTDECDQSEYKVLERYTDGRFGYRMREDCQISDNNYVRMEIASAAKLGERIVLGIRAGGTFWYYNDKYRRRFMRDTFEYSDDLGEYIQDYEQTDDEFQDRSHKLFAGYLETGLTWRDSGELVVRGGYSEGNYIRDDYDLAIDADYDRYTGEMDTYRYLLTEYAENREGDTWLLSVLAKKKYSGGLVLLVAGSHERGSYDCSWRNFNAQYSWGNYVDVQLEEYLLYPGDGTRSRSWAIFRIGKTYALEKKIDLTPGVHIGYEEERFDESGEVFINSVINFQDGPATPTRYSFPVEFDRSKSKTDLVVPLAIEFRAASFFHLYSGFNVSFSWIREVTNCTFLPHYMQPDHPLYPNGTEKEETHFSSDYSASLGFSLRYREKLFFDMFTGTDITPDRVTYYHFDLRYVF